MGLFGKPKHASGETKGQDKVSKHGSKDPRRTPGKACHCGSGISANVCHHQRVGRGGDRIKSGTFRNGRAVGNDKSRKWGR